MLTLLTPPAAEPVSLTQAKDHLRVIGTDEDAVISGYIRAARMKLDGEAGSLGRCLVSQKWRLTLDHFPYDITLPLPPSISVDRIAYTDVDGEEVELASTAYRVIGIGGLNCAIIRPANGASWPSVSGGIAIIEFTAGFGATADAVPEPIRTAILMHVAHLYEHRESVMMGTGFVTGTPHGYDDLIRDYRQWGF